MTNVEHLTPEDIQMPQILVETASRRRGLVLLCGDRFSGLPATAAALWRKVSSGPNRHALYLSSPESPRLEMPAGVKVIDADREQTVEARREIAGCDILFVDGGFDRDRLDRLCTWVEEGRMVVALQSAPAPFVGLRRWFGALSGDGRSHLIWRLCDALQLCLGQMSLPGISAGERVLAHEVILMTPMLRSALESENLHAADETLKLGDETAGTVSFNQSLLQLLIRRRIDMRTAFEATRDPIDLDQLLKKVGL